MTQEQFKATFKGSDTKLTWICETSGKGVIWTTKTYNVPKDWNEFVCNVTMDEFDDFYTNILPDGAMSELQAISIYNLIAKGKTK